MGGTMETLRVEATWVGGGDEECVSLCVCVQQEAVDKAVGEADHRGMN